MNLIVLEKPSVFKLSLSPKPALETLRPLLHEVKTDKKSRCVEKQEVTYGMQVFLDTNANGTLGAFFYHLFTVIYAPLFLGVRFAVIFERLANIIVFENDSRRLFKIIFQCLFSLFN